MGSNALKLSMLIVPGGALAVGADNIWSKCAQVRAPRRGIAGGLQQSGDLHVVFDFRFSPDEVALTTWAEVAVQTMGGR